MTQERKSYLHDKMLSWVVEHVKNEKELFRILHGVFGMTQSELHDSNIDYLDYLFDTSEQHDVQGRMVVCHLYQEDEDYHFTDEVNNDFYHIAKFLRNFWEAADKNLTIDSIAQSYFGEHWEIDALTFSVLADSKKTDKRIWQVISIDLDVNVVRVLDNPLGRWHIYSCQDVVDAVNAAEQGAGYGNELRKRNEFKRYLSGKDQIQGKDIDTSIQEFVGRQMNMQ